MMKSLGIAAIGMWVTLGLLDVLWLSTTTKRFYRPRLGPLLNDRPVWLPALLFYLLFGLGLLVFVLRPALDQDMTLPTVLLYGGFFGLVAYGTYDLVNHATIPNWPLAITVTDMAWGMVASALASVAAVWAARMYG